MKTLSRLFLFLALMLHSLQSVVIADDNVSTILVFGDSLSAGYGLQAEQDWPYLLQQRLNKNKQHWRVVNLSISGETSQGGLLRFPKAIKKYQPQLVILELGANDGLRGQSLKAMRANLSAMIQQSQAIGARVLLAGMHIPPNYGRRYTQAFHNSFATLQKQHQIHLIPFLLTDVATKPELILDDGLHPNALAQEQILNNVWKYLSPLLHSAE